MADDLANDVPSDLVLEARTDHLLERLHLVLFVQVRLGVEEVVDYAVLKFGRNPHILHSRVCRINLLLEPRSEFEDSIAALSSNDALVQLDLEISDDLKLEGIARDLIRSVQQARKDAGLDVADRIILSISANDNDEFTAAVSKWYDLIKEQTLALDISDDIESATFESDLDVVGKSIKLKLKKAD